MSKNKKKKQAKKHPEHEAENVVTVEPEVQEKKSSSVSKKPPSSIFRGILSIGISAVLLTFLVLNIVASQLVDPLYARVVKEEPEAEYEFFSVVRKLPVFTQIYPSMDEIFEQYRTRLEIQDNKRKEQIEELESYLEQNPKSRDIFLVIASLYEQEGNVEQSRIYYEKAREIDPSLPEPSQNASDISL